MFGIPSYRIARTPTVCSLRAAHLPTRKLNRPSVTAPRRLHPEPMSDVLFTEEAIYTIDHSGVLRTWRRPQPEAGSGERE